MAFGTNDQVIFGHDDEIVTDTKKKDTLPAGEMLDYAKKVGKTIQGGAEAGASMVAGLPSQIAGGLYGLGTLLSGQGIEKAGSAVERIQRQNFGAGEYVPSTDVGKKGAENLAAAFAYPGEKAGELGGYIGEKLGNRALGELTAKLPVDTLMNFLPVGAIAAGAKGTVAKGVARFTPEAKVDIAENLRNLKEQSKPFGANDVVVEGDLGAELGYKNQVNAEQAARLEAAIAKQNQALPTIQVDGAGVASEIKPAGRLPNELAQRELFDQPEMGRVANPYEAKLGDWRVDENGIPIKADLSMELANLEQPLQRNLWGDELERTRNPVGQAATLFDQNGLQEGVPLTQAIDSMPWAQRRGAIKSRLTGEIEASNQLKAAIAEANRRPMGSGDPKLGSQRGVVNVAMFDETFKKVFSSKSGDWKFNIIGLGNETSAVLAEYKGKQAGLIYLRKQDHNGEAYATADRVWVEPEYRGHGLARKMYTVVKNMGNDVKASGVQTEAGKAMWESFRKAGLAEGDIIPTAKGEKYVPKGQLGGIAKDSIDTLMAQFRKSVESTSKIDISKIAPKDKNDYASQIPGMGKAAEGIIPRPKGAEDLINEGLKAKDLPDGVRKDIAGGPEMTGDKYRNPIVSGTSSWLQWADKKSKYAIKKLVTPVERAIATMGNKAMIDLADVMKQEMFDRQRATPEQLTAAGMPPKMIEHYNALRESFDTVYDLQAKILRDQGREVPTKQEAYLASMRGGNYHVALKGDKGQTLFYTQARSAREANKAVKWMKEKFPELAKDLKYEYRASNAGSNIPKDILGGFQELMKLVDETSDSALAIKEAIRQAQEEAGYNFRGQSNRFLDKANIRGFEGDMPWLSKQENAHRLLSNQIDYLNSSYKWAYLNDALGEVKNILADERVINQLPNTASYVKDVVKQSLGLQDHFVKGAEEYLMHVVGSSRADLLSASGALGKLTSLLQLGGNLGYAIATPITALFSVAQHAREGTMGMRSMALAVQDSSAGIVNAMLHEGNHAGRLPMSELGQAALKYAEDNGVIAEGMFGDPHKVGSSPGIAGAIGAYELTITFPEKVQRLSTFMSFVHGLKDTGKYNNMYDLFQRAETLTNIAATNFRPSEVPMGVQKFGALGTALFKYKAPLLNYYHQLHMGAIDAGKGNPKALAALLGMTVLLGGVNNLPGVNELDGAWNLFKDVIANKAPTMYEKVKGIGVKEFVKQNIGEAAANGAVQYATGAQMQQRFGADVANVEDPLKNALPVAGMVSNIAGAVGSLAKGNAEQALWNMSPQVIRGNMEVGMDSFKGTQPGTYRKPSDLSNPDIQQARTEKDELYRRLSLRSKEEASRLETRAQVNQEEKRIKTALEGITQKAVNAAVKKDTAAVDDYIKSYLELNPDGNALQADLSKKLERATLTPEQRDMIRMRTILQVRKMQRLQDARN